MVFIMPTNSKQLRSRTFTGQRNYEYETHILNEKMALNQKEKMHQQNNNGEN